MEAKESLRLGITNDFFIFPLDFDLCFYKSLFWLITLFPTVLWETEGVLLRYGWPTLILEGRIEGLVMTRAWDLLVLVTFDIIESYDLCDFNGVFRFPDWDLLIFLTFLGFSWLFIYSIAYILSFSCLLAIFSATIASYGFASVQAFASFASYIAFLNSCFFVFFSNFFSSMTYCWVFSKCVNLASRTILCSSMIVKPVVFPRQSAKLSPHAMVSTIRPSLVTYCISCGVGRSKKSPDPS